MKKVNMYFFGGEKVHPTDFTFFYGTYAACLIITAVAIF